MRTKAQIEVEISALQQELKALPPYDWDNMTTKELEEVFTAEVQDRYWNAWDNCPVGSLTGGRPDDHALMLLGSMTKYAADRDWMCYMEVLRRIVRLRLQETNT